MLIISDRSKKIMVLLLILLTYLAAFLITDYHSFQLTIVWIYAIILFGYNLLTGYNGQLSLGQSAFYAIGAYATVLMIKDLGLPYYMTILPAGIICFFFGFLFGFPALRLKGPFLALATFALVIIIPQLLKRFDTITGGAQGLSIPKPEVPFGLPITQDQWIYFLSLTIMIVLFILGRNFIKSDSGKAIIAIRDNPLAAAAMGINITFYKTLTFGISGFYGGVAGSLAAIAVQFISPDMFTIALTISFLIGITVGGLSSISGPLFGALFIQFIPMWTNDISKSAHVIIYGLLIMIIMCYMPTGLAGFFKLALKRSSSYQ